ncbi:hypothetical protein BAU67_001980 [Escherichia coli]|nr:hypothetical protein [Escherichia coli]EMB7054221.1 hypothetical protein [Escherichia coli]
MSTNKTLQQAEELLHKLVSEWKIEYSDFNAREGEEYWPTIRSEGDWYQDFIEWLYTEYDKG